MSSSKLVTEEFKVKGMICSRCLKVLNTELKAVGVEVLEIELGKIVIRYNDNKSTKAHIENVIQENEFEIIWDKHSILAEKVKRWIITYVWNSDHDQNLSEYLANKTENDYTILSKNFSHIFGRTIERYCLQLKIECAKETIENGEQTFSEIAYLLGYQNLSALSRQFKKETGMTLKQYKMLGQGVRIPIDKI